MVDLVKGEIIPASIGYQNELSTLLNLKKSVGDYDGSLEAGLLDEISKLSGCLVKKLSTLETAILESKEEEDVLAQAVFYRDRIFASMSELRLVVDELETLVARKHWPLPSYAKLLYSVI
jgi:glutamine synthetase